MIQRYRFCLPRRQITQTDIVKDIYDLFYLWTFPEGQFSEIDLCLCEAGYKELKALDQSDLSKFFTSLCGPDSRVNILSHAELERGLVCQ